MKQKLMDMVKWLSVKNKWMAMVYAFLTALAVTMNLEAAEAAEAGIENSLYQGVYKIIEKTSQDLAGRGLMLTALAVCLYVVYRKVWVEMDTKAIRYSKGLSVFLSIMYTGGMGFAFDNSLSVLYTSTIRIFKTLILLAGVYVWYLTAINAFYHLLKENNKTAADKKKGWRCYEKHPWLMTWALIMGCWLVHLLLRYPGTMSYDNWDQLSYYYDFVQYTTAQPVFHTWIFGSFINFGLLLGSASLGLFAFVLFQSLAMSAVLAWSLMLMRKWGTPDWLRILTTAVYCMAPYYTGYASFPIKDFLYTACFIVLVLLCMEWAKNTESFWESGWHKFGWAACACLLILFRKNGVVVYFSMAFVIGFCEMKSRLRSNRLPQAAVGVIGLVVPIILAFGVEGIIGAVYDVEKDSPKEMLSLPFQQTARYVRDYGDEISEEERESIASVLDYENLPNLYLEFTSDPVKTTFHAKDSGALADYFKVWFRQFWRHPLCYVEATWNQNYYVFAPNIDHIVFNKDCHVGEEIVVDLGMLEKVRFEIPQRMQGICAVMASLYSLLMRIPVIGILNNVAFYIILLFVIWIFMMKDGCRKELLALIPLFMTFLFILIGPQIMNQPRYAFPIIYAMPSVVAYYMQATKKES